MQKQLHDTSLKGLTGFARRIRKTVSNKTIAVGFLIAGSIFSAVKTQAQTTILSEDFETGSTGWTIVNGTQVNKWFVGTAAAAGGTQSAYISDDAAGATNNYILTTASTTHIYRDVAFPAGQTDFQLTFKWKAQGEGTTDLDNLKVFLTSTGTTVTAGTVIAAADRIGATWYNLSAGSGYITTTISLSPTLAGTTQRLVFSWKNNATLGTQPPASIDDIIITSRAPVPLSGTFTIDKTIPTAGTNFASFTDAINKINIEGVAGPVTFNVIAGQNFIETPPVITATGTAANPIIFQKSGAGSNPKITAGVGVSTSLDGIIILAGSDYMTFDGIDLEDPATNSTSTTRMEFGYALLRASNTNGAQFNTIKNSTVTLQKAYTGSYGIYSSSHTQFSTTAVSGTGATTAGTNSNNKIFSNTITNVYIGIYIQGISTAAVFDVNNRIGVDGGNTITNFGGAGTTTYGIYSVSQENYQIANNIITGGTGTTSTLYGIFMSSAVNSTIQINNNNINVTSSSTSSDIYGINNAGGATGTNNLVKIYDNTIQITAVGLSTSSTIYGIQHSASSFNAEIYNNTIGPINRVGTGSTYGIYQSGSIVNSVSVYNNSVSNITSTENSPLYGLYSSSAANLLMYGNTVSNFTTTSPTGNGIYLASGSIVRVYNNRIFNLSSSSTTSALNGIHNFNAVTVYAYNNFISDLKTPIATATDAIRGIYINGGSFNGVYFNTIFLNATSSSATTFGTSGILVNTTYPAELRNNIIVNSSTPGPTGGFTVAYRRSTTTITNYAATSNNNIFYAGTPGANRLIFYDGTNSDQTIGAYRNRVTPRDDRSTSELPPFVNITTAPFDLHLQTNVPTSAESGGTPITSPIAITLDFDSQTRNTTTPDIGADEGNFLFGDLVAPTISYNPIGNTTSTANRTLTATISDVSGIPVSGTLVPRIYYRKGTSGAYVSQPGILTGGTATNGTWTFTVLSTDVGGLTNGNNIDYFIVAQDVAGNLGSTPVGVVATDVNTITATTFYRYYINAPIPAIITVPGMFTSLSNAGGAFEAINQAVLTGNVLINITGDLTAETGAVGLNQWAEEGTGNYSLAIRPDAAVNRTISGTGTAGLGMIRMSGADRVTIDGSFNGSGRFLTLINTGTAASALTLQVVNGAENNTIRNLNISTGSNTVANWAFVSNGTTNTNLLLENNNFTKAQTAISIQNAATSPTIGLQIRNNIIGSQTAADYVSIRGISLTNATAPIVAGNTITLNTALSSLQAAIEIGTNVTGASVTKNVISGLRTTASVATVGIYVSTGTGVENNTIDNNMISDILSPGVASSISNPIGIRLDGGSNTKIYYNSVYLTGVQTTTGLTRSAALYVNTTTLPGLDIRNNIFANSMTGSATAKAYAVYAISGVNFGTINYNNYFTSGANAVFGFLGADVTTLAAWKTATSQDANSISVDPQFISATDLHITTSNLALNNLGTPIATVTTDIDNDVRNATTPDMGADEFTPASLDLGAFALVSPVNKICFGAAEQVTVTIKNLGITPVNFAATNATLTVTATVPTGATAPTLPVITFIDNSLNGGNPLAVGATLNVPVGTINMTTPGAYTFNAATNVISGGMDGNSANDAIDPVTITVAPLAGGTATAVQASICQSGTTTINLVGNSGGDVQWQSGPSATGPFTNISGATSSSFTLPAAITQTSYYQAKVSCGSNTATSNVVTVTVNNPTISASAGATRCGSGTVNLSATPSAGATINWYTTATGGTPVANGNTFTPNVTATTTYYAEAFEGAFTTNVGATTNTIGTGAQSTVTHYLLFDAFTAFTLNSVYVYPNAAGNVVLELRNSANTILQTATVAVTAAQVGVKTLIPLNFAIAPGTGYKIGRGTASVSLYRNDGGAVYPYTVPGVLSITGNSFNAVSYYWAYDWNISSGCGSARTAVVATVNPVPAPTFTGLATTYCSTDPAVTLVSSISGSTFTINGTAATTFNPATLGAGSHTVIVSSTNASNCTGTATQTVTVSAPAAVPTITAGGATTFCTGGSVTLTAASTTTGATYEWFLNGSPIAGATSSTYMANAGGNYTAVATANGCPSAASTATTVTVNPAAAVPTITAGGATTFCTGGSVTLTATSATTGATYTWFLNGSPIAGATSATYTANAAGNYTAVATATGCPSAASAAMAVTVNAPAALPTIAAGGPTTFCAGGSVALTAASTTTGATYTWFLNGTPITGATSATYTANAAGNYTAVATANGCPSAASAGTTVTVNALPATPTIAQNGGVLTSSAATGNQWYLNGILIPGATGQNYTTAANGAYTVITTGTNGCASTASAVKNVTNTGLNAALAEMGIQVYPNPNNGSFNVKLTGYQKDATITLYNLAGQLIATETVKAANTDQNVKAMNLKGLAAGTYLLKVMSDKGTQVTRLVVE